MKAVKNNTVLCRRFARAASSQSNINGYLFLPTLKYPFGKPLPVGTIKPKTPAHEALKNLKQATSAGAHLSITGHMRGLDGPGSSLDLPEFQLRLTEPGVTGINQLPSTLTVASGFESTVRIEPASDPEAIEYVATDYGLYKPHVNKGPVVLTPQGKCPKGMLDAPAYVLTNLFGLKGIRVTVEAIAPMALAGGMESSNVFLTSLLAAGSMLSGSDLSEADIFALAVKLENDEFSGLTGGQGHLCCLLGGAHRHVWLSGVCDSYAAFSHTVLPESSLLDLEKHIMLVQAGKEYLNGKAVTARTAALTNNMWTDLLRDNDEVGLPLHKEKIGATATFTAALARKDFKTVVEVVQRYTEIRDLITCRWLTLAVDAHLGRQVPEHAKAYAKKSLGADDAEYKVVRDLFAIHKEGIKKISLYTLDPISTLVAKGRKEGVAIMPLGAGGPGANSIAISAEGDQHLRSFLHSNGLPELEPDNVRKIITGTGLLKGYAPVVTGKHPLRYTGFDKIGLSPPSAPVKIVNETYQQLLSRLPVKKA